VSTVDTARAVDPKTRVNMRVHRSSRMSPEAPDRKKHVSTTEGMTRAASNMRTVVPGERESLML
jgi:hypothetical protein